jgi:hypothetical protein
MLIVAMLVTVGFTGCSAEQLIALQGVIQNADTLSGTITVKMQDGSIQTFNFADVKVETVIAALGGLSLEPGDTVIIKQDKNGQVQEVIGSFAKVDGIISGLGTDSVSINTEKGANITLEATPETVIRIEGDGAVDDVDDGAVEDVDEGDVEDVDDGDVEDVGEGDIEDRGAGNFTDLQVGQQVEAKYDVTSLEALTITVDDYAENDIEGTITAIDPDNHMVTIATEEKGDIVLRVTSDTILRIEDKGTATFGDLELGLRVQAEYDVSSKDALKIKVDDGAIDDVDNEDVNDGDADMEEEELKVEGLVIAYDEGVSIEVDGQLFNINEDTDLEGAPVVSTSIVEVKYVVQDDDSFLAVEIAVQNDED